MFKGLTRERDKVVSHKPHGEIKSIFGNFKHTT